MEILKLVICDFVLFSLIEAFIFCLFFKYVGEINIRFKDILIVGVVNTIIMAIPNITFKQLIVAIFMGVYLYVDIKENKIEVFDCIKISIISVVFVLVTETIYVLFMEILGFIPIDDLVKDIDVFLYLLPIKLLEIIIIRRGRMKIWWKDIKKPVKK